MIDSRLPNGVTSPAAAGAWLAARPGLADAARRWEQELAPVRAAVPERVADLTSPGHRLVRIRRLVVLIAVLLAEGALATVLALPRRLLGRGSAGRVAAHRLRRAFEHLGPFYVKLGQFISSGRGLFPDVLVEEFATCRDRCPELSTPAVRRAVERELGPMAELFSSFDPRPIAAASIAQVHAATLLDGTPVVVKVQRPGMARRVETYIRTMPALARLVERLFPRRPIADPHELVTLFATTILEELDFRLEAQNMIDTALDLEEAGIDDVVVPRPIPGMVTGRVLVMERLEGMRFDDLIEMQAAGIDTAALLLSGLRALVEGATVFGRFHGDLHAGNIICLPDGRFGLVDFGIYARLDDDARVGLQRLLVGIATSDPRFQVHGLDGLGALPARADRRELVARFTVLQERQQETVSIDDLRDGAPQLMGIFTDHRLHLCPALFLFFKDVLYLNGSTRLLAPDLDLLSVFTGLHRYFDDKYGPDRLPAAVDPYGPPITSEELDRARDTEPDLDGEPDAPPTLASVARRLGPRFLTDSIVPALLILGINGVTGLPPAVLAVTAWSAGLVVVRRRSGRGVGILLPITLGYIAVRGAASALMSSDAVYFGPSVVTDSLVALAMAASVAVRRPLIGSVAQALYRFSPSVRRHPVFTKVFARLSLAWAGYFAATALLKVWLLATASTDTYVIVRSAVGWPVGIGLLVVSLRYPRRAFRRHPDLAERVARAEAALHQPRGVSP